MNGTKRCWGAAVLLVAAVAASCQAPAATGESSPCQGAVDLLLTTYDQDATFRALTDRALANAQPLSGEGTAATAARSFS